MIGLPKKLAAVFSILTFLMLTLTMTFTGLVILVMVHIGIFDIEKPFVFLVTIVLVSMLAGVILSKCMTRHSISEIVNISGATKEIAKGNFDVELNEDINIAELHDMAHNFNIMARELARTEMLRNDFIENVSHEFKTPLAAIEGYSTLLQKKDLTEGKRQEYARRILHNVRRLSVLTSNILLLSRLENQDNGIPREEFCLDEQLREVILLFEDKWNEKELELEIDLDSVDYYGNKELLANVWQNILENAIKFVAQGGWIRVLLRREDAWIRVSIADNGAGMSAEVRQRVFEKFYQGDRSRSSQGNGLGLALAKRIVNMHDGNIEVNSKEGKGTEFTVLLPVNKVKEGKENYYL